MTTAKIKCGMFGPGRRGFYPIEYTSEDNISERQRRKLVDYINSLHNDDEDLRATKLAQIEEMTYNEADDLLHEVSKWR